MKVMRVFMLAAVMLASLATSGLLEPQAAEAAGATTFRVSTTQTIGPFGIPAIKVALSAGMRSSGGRIYAEWVDCRIVYSYAYYVTKDWCGTVWNGSSSYMEVGMNSTVSVLIKGFPASRSCWLRIRIYPSGYAYAYGGC